MTKAEKALTNVIHLLDVLQTSGLTLTPEGAQVKADCEEALAEIDKCEPVAGIRWIKNLENIQSEYFEHGWADGKKLPVGTKFYTSPQPIEKCEPVAEAIRERDRLGFAVVNVMTKLDEIIDTTQEVEIDDFLHIAVPIDMWNELQAALEDMPKRADLYTSPQPRDWVGLTDAEALKLWDELHPDSEQRSKKDYWLAIEAKLKQLNTKG